VARESTILLNLLNWHPKKIEAVIAYCERIDDVLNLTAGDFGKIPAIKPKDAINFFKMRDSALFKEELNHIKREGIICVDLFDEHYPELLKQIDASPLLLYTQGDLGVLKEKMFAVVGSRIPTHYGISMAGYFSYQLASLGFVVVSGLARGIDAVAHREALKSGKSIAVLGSGLLNVYPRENKSLAQSISAKGLVISEFPLFVPPLKENFPRRNRIVSGLSQGVLVVEATARSGALITAHLAIEQNREVFAIPGNIDSPLSKGTNSLLKEGAKPVDCMEDIFEEIPFQRDAGKDMPSFNLNLQEEEIFKALSLSQGIFLEELMSTVTLDRVVINKAIMNLQLKGIIKELKPNYFVRAHLAV
jgi:DNA processing protein